MISLSKSGGTVTFTFDDNSGYLQNGTIEVPVNSLSLILDESNMATFRKSASNDIFVSANIAEFGMSKSELESWYKDNMVGSTGGGGATYTAGRGIDIDSGNTISFTLPISAGTGNNSIAEGNGTTASGQMSHAEGWNTIASGWFSHAEGNGTKASGWVSHTEGDGTKASGFSSHAEGWNTIANNDSEHASGQWNISSSSSRTFGDSGNTLFSVGNGTADYARHNAFEIRQNGDIYITSGNTDIKLQDNLGGGISSGEVQSMINAATSGAVGSFGDFYVGIDDEGYEVTYLDYGNQEGVGLGAIKFAGEGSGLSSDDNGLLTVVGKVNESTFNSYSASTNTALTGKADVSAVTQSINAATSGAVGSFGDFYVDIDDEGYVYTYLGYGNQEGVGLGAIKFAGEGSGLGNDNGLLTVVGKVNESTFNSYSASTNAALNGKVNTSSVVTAVTSASTDSQIPTAKAVYDAIPTGGSGSYSAGSGISISNNTISTDLNVYKGQAVASVSLNNSAGNGSGENSISGTASVGAGFDVQTMNYAEAAFGTSNVSNGMNGSMTKDSGTTLFSVGNGSQVTRHNAFEIRQNGDIYITYGADDIKLQDKLDEIEQVTARALVDVNAKFGGLKLQQISQADYDALVSGGTVDNSTLYIITNVVN